MKKCFNILLIGSILVPALAMASQAQQQQQQVRIPEECIANQPRTKIHAIAYGAKLGAMHGFLASFATTSVNASARAGRTGYGDTPLYKQLARIPFLPEGTTVGMFSAAFIVGSTTVGALVGALRGWWYGDKYRKGYDIATHCERGKLYSRGGVLNSHGAAYVNDANTAAAWGMHYPSELQRERDIKGADLRENIVGQETHMSGFSGSAIKLAVLAKSADATEILLPYYTNQQLQSQQIFKRCGLLDALRSDVTTARLLLARLNPEIPNGSGDKPSEHHIIKQAMQDNAQPAQANK